MQIVHAQAIPVAYEKMSLQNEHGVAIAVKTIFLLNGFSVKFLEPRDAFFATGCEKGGNEAE